MTFQAPVDGERLPLVYNGVPWVMEYDADTGAWKPVVSFEDIIAVTITGANIEITPGEYVNVSGTVNIRGPVVQANETTPAQYAEDSPHSSGQTGTFVLGVRQDAPMALAAEGDYTPLLTDLLGRLQVFTSGSYVTLDSDIQIGAVEIKDSLTSNRAIVTADGRVWVSALVTGSVTTLAGSLTALSQRADVAIASPVRTLASDALSAAFTGVAVASHLLAYDGDVGDWERVRLTSVGDSLSPTDVLPSLVTAGLGYAFEGAWLRNRAELISGRFRLNVHAVVTGTVDTELPAATAAADFITPSASPAVQGFGYVYDQSNDLWLRMRTVRDADQGVVRNITGSVAATGFTRFWEGNIAGWEKALMDTSKRLMVSALVTGSVTAAGTFALSSQLVPAQYAEDSLHVSGETGTFVLAVRQDNPAPLASAGDYSPFTTDSLGRLHTFTSGSFVSLSSDIQIGAVEIKDSDTDNRLRVTADGRAWVSALVTGSVDTELPAAAALADTTANPTAPAVGAFLHGYDPNDGVWNRLRLLPISTGATDTDLGPSLYTRAIAFAYSPGNDEYRRIHTEQIGGRDRLNTHAVVTGTVAISPTSSLSINQRADVAIASPVGSSAADDITATTTGVLTRSTLLVYDEGGDNWDRLRGTAIRGARVDLISGSHPWKNIVRAAITLSGSGGEATVVAGIPGQRIKVLEVMLITDANNQIRWKDGAGGSNLTGPATVPNSGDGYFLPSPTNPDHFHFQTGAGTALVLDRSQISLLGGHISYYLEP